MTPNPGPIGTAREASPFEMPAMADAYPLDPAERATVDEMIAHQKRERRSHPMPDIAYLLVLAIIAGLLGYFVSVGLAVAFLLAVVLIWLVAGGRLHR